MQKTCRNSSGEAGQSVTSCHGSGGQGVRRDKGDRRDGRDGTDGTDQAQGEKRSVANVYGCSQLHECSFGIKQLPPP